MGTTVLIPEGDELRSLKRTLKQTRERAGLPTIVEEETDGIEGVPRGQLHRHVRRFMPPAETPSERSQFAQSVERTFMRYEADSFDGFINDQMREVLTHTKNLIYGGWVRNPDPSKVDMYIEKSRTKAGLPVYYSMVGEV